MAKKTIVVPKVYLETSFVSYLTGDEVTDAFHIATAAIAGMDFLLTWNCKHMANPRTLPKTMSIIGESGFVCPQIMTPQTYIENIFMEG